MATFIDWPSKAPVFSKEDIKSLLDLTSSQIPEITVENIVKNCVDFPRPFPIETVKCSYLRSRGIPDNELNKNINSVYPVLHETTLPLFLQFLNHKRRFGSNIERELYKDYTVEKLIDRFLKKRAVTFCGPYDYFMLLDGNASWGDWEIIGTDTESPPRVLENCLSYDEIKLSALLSVSSHTCFINNGTRANCGKYQRDVQEIEKSGVIIGLIGPRCAKPEVMEYQDIIVSKEQNVKEKGYGKSRTSTIQGIFLRFYEEPSATYKELKKELKKNEKKYFSIAEKIYFNNNVFAKRLALSIDTLLIEANNRAREIEKMAYVFVVGIGLGVWRISSHQEGLFMDVFCQRIRFLGSNLRNVSDICFSYIDSEKYGEYKHGDTMPIVGHPNEGIKIHIIRGDPHVKLAGEDEGKLLVVSYAWDGNALPGNEFWAGNLATSSDPAAASSTQVAELHNPHINPKVSAANLRIATLNNGIQPFSEYVKKIIPTK